MGFIGCWFDATSEIVVELAEGIMLFWKGFDGCLHEMFCVDVDAVG